MPTLHFRGNREQRSEVSRTAEHRDELAWCTNLCPPRPMSTAPQQKRTTIDGIDVDLSCQDQSRSDRGYTQATLTTPMFQIGARRLATALHLRQRGDGENG